MRKLFQGRGSQVGFFILGLGLIYYFRPLFHPLAMALWVNPIGTILVIIALVTLLRAVVLGRKEIKKALTNANRQTDKTRSTKTNLSQHGKRLLRLTGAGISLLVLAMIYGGIAEDFRMAQAVKTYSFAETSSLPVLKQNRLVPLPVADRFGVDALQRPTERAHEWHPQLWDDKFSWVAALTPDGAVRFWLNKAAGLQVIDATTSQRQTEVINQELQVSEGVGLRDNIHWQLLKQRYLIDLPDVYYGKVNDRIYAVAPILSYKGFLVKYPVFDGVFIVSPEGEIEELAPAEAAKHPAVLAAGRLYPESYIRFVHESYALKNGVTNKWFRHVDQTEISDLSHENNRQPYMLATQEGLMWVSAADPWGDSFGIYKIFLTNALSGETKMFSVPKDSSLTGASQAVGYVKSFRPQYNWAVESSDGDSGNILAIEPRPVFINQQLLWMISVTTTEAKGINETCFVNARSNAVNCFTDDQKIMAFLQTGDTSLINSVEDTQNLDHQRLEEIEQALRKALQELEALKTER